MAAPETDFMAQKDKSCEVNLNTETKFIFSTSGSQTSIIKYNEALKQLGLNLVYFSFAHPVSPEVYAGLLRSPITRGAAVTGKGGLKSSIIPFLDEVEPLALKTLTVNTVVNNGGKLYGYNTDSYGLKTALQKGISESGIKVKTAVIYGYGGVSGAAYFVLQEMGIRVTMAGRDPEKLARKKTALGIGQEDHFQGPWDLLVDATPVSSEADFLKSEGLEGILKNCKMVFCHNMPEREMKTNYLKVYCEENKITFIPGKWMHEAQQLKQYSLFLEGYTKNGTGTIQEKDIAAAFKTG
jgi:shikimate dehydrogenase